VVAMERMNRILAFDRVDRTLTVQAGVVTEAVQAAARSHSLFYPVDFASRGSSQIGGNVATNAGGIKVLRYGMTRDWVTGLKVVAGTGDLLDLNRGLVKNATGYDLRHLFIGSEGTLGFVVEATLELTAPPSEQQVMVLALADMSALMSVFASLREHMTLSAFEFFDDRRTSRRKFDLRRTGFFQSEWRGVSALHKIADQRRVCHARFELCRSCALRAKGALDRKTNFGSRHGDIAKGSPFYV